MPELEIALILIAAGFVAGVVNTIAGGGSLLTLPALIFAGLDASLANGTNRISILLQSGASTWTMYRRVPFPLKSALFLALPTTLGAVSGALMAAEVEAGQMRQIIGWVLVVMAALLALRPKRFLESREGPREITRARKVALWIALLVVGVYGGFLQAGSGVIFVVVISAVGGWDLLEATGAKNLIIALYSILVLGIFLYHGQVDWIAGLLVALGSVAGAEIGARLAVRGGRRVVLGAIIAVVLVASVRLTGLWDLIVG